MKNEFSLYKSTASEEELIKMNEAEKDFKEVFADFEKKWKALGTKYQKLGANDTASKGAQLRWIVKQFRGAEKITKEELHERFREVSGKLRKIYEIAKTEQILEASKEEMKDVKDVIADAGEGTIASDLDKVEEAEPKEEEK